MSSPSLPGGPANKFVNRYEERWTVFCMIQVMREYFDSIRLEPPGEDGAEFQLCQAGQYEYHQVKRQQGRTGHWTLHDLNSKGILAYFCQKLKEEPCRCVFVSTQSAD